VDVGDVDAKAEKLLIPVDLSEYPSNEEIASTLLKKVPKGVHNVLIDFITRLYAVYVDCQFTYLEINPLVVIPNKEGTSAEVYFLDLAAKLDQTAEFECGVKWAVARGPAALGMPIVKADKVSIDAGPPMEFPAPFGRDMSKEESYIAELDAKTGAIASAGFSDELANYGEYSGAPTETQTFYYARTVLDLMLRAPISPEGKVLFIGGGIANFTNVGNVPLVSLIITNEVLGRFNFQGRHPRAEGVCSNADRAQDRDLGPSCRTQLPGRSQEHQGRR